MSKEISFMSTDGVKISKGDSYWYVYNSRPNKYSAIMVVSAQDISKGDVQYSTEDGIKRYINGHS